MASSQSEQSEIFTGVSCWMVCSVGLMVFNKLAITEFPLECTLVAMQMLFTAAAMVTVCWSSIHIGSLKDALRWCMVVPFFCGMLLTSMFALSNASMTTVVTFRAITPLVALSIERFYPNPLKVTPAIVACIMAMIGGAIIYAHEMDISDRAAIGWLALNNFFALGDRLLQRLMLAKDQNPVDISKTGVTMLNNAIGMVPLAVVAYCTGEFKDLGPAFSKMDNMGMCWVAVSCVVGLGISYCGVWAQSLISATSFLVLVNANKFFIIFLETFVMGTKTMSPIQIIGASIAVLAAAAYGEARSRAEAETKKEPVETTPILDKNGKSSP